MEKPLGNDTSIGLPPTESASRRALLPTQAGVATDDNLNNSTVASIVSKAQGELAATDEKQADDGGKKKANAPTKESARIAQSKKKNQVEEKGKGLTLPEGGRIICQGYSRLLLDSVNAETASATPADDAVVNDVKEVVGTGAKTKKAAARRKSKGKPAVDNNVDAPAELLTKAKKSAARKIVDSEAPVKSQPKGTKGKKAAAKKAVVPSISVRAATARKGKGKTKEIKLSRFAPVAEGSNAVKRKAPEDDEEADEDRDAGDDDDARRPTKRLKVVT
ncbi:hypothetical protein ONZ45_g12417 [Pleurotus djamor]|nr:hypothetical protein ONZ45_g12417 [Pleurotus djamor]